MNIKPVILHGKEIPTYFVSECGRIFTYEVTQHPTTKHFCKNPTNKLVELKQNAHKSKKYLRVNFTVPKKMFIEEYEYSSRRKGKQTSSIERYVHSVVMHSFRPIDLYPPEKLKDVWNDLPEVAKEWIRDTVYIHHKDHNPFNNHINNLEYVTPKQNTQEAVKFYNGNTANKKSENVIVKKSITVFDFID